MTIDCFYEARHHDKKAEAELTKLGSEADDTDGWLDLAAKWHEQRKFWLKNAARSLRGFVPRDLWAEAKAKAEIG